MNSSAFFFNKVPTPGIHSSHCHLQGTSFIVLTIFQNVLICRQMSKLRFGEDHGDSQRKAVSPGGGACIADLRGYQVQPGQVSPPGIMLDGEL